MNLKPAKDLETVRTIQLLVSAFVVIAFVVGLIVGLLIALAVQYA